MIGRLTTQIVIQAPVEAHDHGEIVTSWTTLATLWAEVLPRGSRETYRQSQVMGEMDYLVRVRNRDDVTAKHRITFGSHTLQLLGPPQEVTIDGVRLIEMACAEVET